MTLNEGEIRNSIQNKEKPNEDSVTIAQFTWRGGIRHTDSVKFAISL